MNGFNVGDEVEIIDTYHCHYLKVGDVGVITNIAKFFNMCATINGWNFPIDTTHEYIRKTNICLENK